MLGLFVGHKFGRCLVCKTGELKRQRKTCSIKCQGEWIRKYYSGNSAPNWRGGSTKKCKECGKVIPRVRTSYCSRKCMQEHYKTILLRGFNPNWRGGNKEYGGEFDSALKERIRFRDKYRCKVCGCSQLENGKHLDVHHINYNKFCSVSSNLISLCHACHCKTNGNRSYWQRFFTEKVLYEKAGISYDN